VTSGDTSLCCCQLSRLRQAPQTGRRSRTGRYTKAPNVLALRADPYVVKAPWQDTQDRLGDRPILLKRLTLLIAPLILIQGAFHHCVYSAMHSLACRRIGVVCLSGLELLADHTTDGVTHGVRSAAAITAIQRREAPDGLAALSLLPLPRQCAGSGSLPRFAHLCTHRLFHDLPHRTKHGRARMPLEQLISHLTPAVSDARSHFGAGG
jgi:hypothetical protein